MVIEGETMRRLWECQNWEEFINFNCRTGVRLRFENDVDPEVRRSCIQFVSWLRCEYEFPIRVPIYFKATETIKTMNGGNASASFFGPFDISQEPYIRIAVGDYEYLLEQRGQDNALAAILHSITHELSHYFQWIKYHEIWLENNDSNIKYFERQAKYYAHEIVLDYAEIVDHP